MGTSARIDELRKKFDENPRRYFAPLANEYRKSGDLEQAIFICQEYLPQQPGHMSGHIVYGQALYESGRAEDAKAVFETALSLDPENLIALRHLGDIARSSGDPAGARGWYQRVLDADPRNDEIMQLLAVLDSSPLEAPPSPVASTPDRMRSTPLATPAVELLDLETSEEPARTSVTEGPEIEKSQEALTSGFDFGDRGEDESRLDQLGDFEVPPLPPAHPAPAAATTSDDDLLDLDDFSIGGVAAQASAAPAPVEEAEPTGLDGDVTISGGFTLGTEDGESESAPFAAAPSAPSPDIDLATDINLGLADDSVPPSVPAAETVSLAGLETFEAGVIAGAPDDVPILETEGFFDLPPVAETSAPEPVVATSTPQPVAEALTPEPVAEASTPEPVAEMTTPEPVAEMSAAGEPWTLNADHDGFDAPVSTDATEAPDVAATTFEPPVAEAAPEPVEAFVTETMAELYIQQGHLDSALDIYRRLVEQRPEEPELHERLHALEDRIFGAPAVTEADVAHSPPPPSYGGPTIREFLMGLVSRTPASSARRPSDPVADFSDDVEPPRRESRMTPGASETITGSIDALFSGAGASASDTAAADTLAAAFAETEPDPAPPESTPLEGTPAHRAQDELSLDHVFKATTPPRQSGGANGFSFDQFFADEMADPAEESSADAAPGSPEATDDIAQFNAWLNGLKKT
jgi:tetratricopeptide (TPR) repeat protein